MSAKVSPYWQRWTPWVAKHGYRVTHRLTTWEAIAEELWALDGTKRPASHAVNQTFRRVVQLAGHVPLTREDAVALQVTTTGKPLTPPPEPQPIRMSSPAPKDVHDYLTLPPPPFAVAVPVMGAPAIGVGWRRSLVWGDSHYPSQDDLAVGVVMQLATALQPEGLVHIGDIVDCYTISRFSKDPNRLHTLQDEIDMARTHLHQMAQLCPSAERWLLEGNHEDRLRRLIWDLPGGTAELARLTAFREAMTWPMLLQLDDIGWQFVPIQEQSHKAILPKLIVKHGDVVRKWSAWTAKGEYERYGRGGISGHTHRLGAFFHRDHNGSHVWWESGCTCRLDQSYCVDPDWQQGCLVVTHTADGGRYTIEPVYIEVGRAIWRDRELVA